MSHLITSIKKLHLYLKVFFSEIFKGAHVVKMSAYFNLDGSLQHLNWGDDINYWFLNAISTKPIVSYDWSLLTRLTGRKYVMGIGSLLTLAPLDNSIIWGSGIMSQTAPFRGRPREVRAVRGPLTRKRLLEKGINCPEVYGDPALLLPRYYKPKVQKKHKLGIIPHYKDASNEVFNRFRAIEDINIIDIRNYDDWHDFIDQICSCDSIVSTSLHGLIVSEAYSIPNLWIQLADKRNEDCVKFHDFFLSIGIDRIPFYISQTTTIDDLTEALKSYRKGKIDLQPLLDSCPFDITI